jgi:lipopolysaccharide export system protein LptA
MTIEWNERMEFVDGRVALFEGGVQAVQQNTRLLAQNMQVMLQKTVYLNPAAKPKLKQGEVDEPAKVDHVVCDQEPRNTNQPRPKTLPPVQLTDVTYEKGKLKQSQQLEGTQMDLNNTDNKINASGPGVVRILAMGSKDGWDPAVGPSKGPAPKSGAAEEEMKFTKVTFQGMMSGDNKNRTATFHHHVEVTHVPSDDPNTEVNTDKLPPGGFVLRCEKRLVVYTTQKEDGTKSQQMQATGDARVEAREFTGQADEIDYDQGKDLVVFRGTSSIPARLFRVLRTGEEPQVLKGTTIMYWRKTNECTVKEGTGINIQQPR